VRAGTLRREFDAELTSRVAVFAAEIKPTLDRLDVARAIAEQPNVPATPVTVRRGDGTLVYESPDVPHLTDEWERAAAQGAAKHLGFQTVRDATRQEQRLVNRFVTSPDGYPYVVQLMASPTSIDEGIPRAGGVAGDRHPAHSRAGHLRQRDDRAAGARADRRDHPPRPRDSRPRAGQAASRSKPTRSSSPNWWPR
jgi:hypothetical protein